MFCQGVDGEALEELQEDDDSVVNPIELDYENNGTNDYDDEEDAEGYTNNERAALQLLHETNVGPANNDEENDSTVIGVVVVVVVVDDDDDDDDDDGVDG